MNESRIGRQFYIFHGFLLLTFTPLLVLHFQQLWRYDHYQYAPFYLLLIPLVIWSQWGADEGEEVAPPKRFHMGGIRVLYGLGAAVLTLAVIGWSPNLAAVGFGLTAGGAILAGCCYGMLSRFFAIWLLFAFLVRMPLNMDVDLIFWLQGTTSHVGSVLLDFFTINHCLVGHVIKVPDQSFMVEDACSGIQSLFALLASTGLILSLVNRSLLHSILLLLMGVLWACVANILRVVTIVLVQDRYDIDWATGTSHDVLGFVLFMLAVGMLVSTDRLLLFLLERPHHVVDIDFSGYQQEVDEELKATGSGAADKPEEPEDLGAPWTLGKPKVALAGWMGLLGVMQLLMLSFMNLGTKNVSPDDPRLVGAVTEQIMPENLGSWERGDFKTETRSHSNYMGRNSASWQYTDGEQQLVIAVDYPFLGWHELTNCYTAQGYTIAQREVDEATSRVEAIVESGQKTSGLVLFSEFSTDGTPLSALGNNAGTIAYWKSRVESSMLRQFAVVRENPANYQIQLVYFYDSAQPPSDEQIEALRKVHTQACERISAVINKAMQQ